MYNKLRSKSANEKKSRYIQVWIQRIEKIEGQNGPVLCIQDERFRFAPSYRNLVSARPQILRDTGVYNLERKKIMTNTNRESPDPRQCKRYSVILVIRPSGKGVFFACFWNRDLFFHRSLPAGRFHSLELEVRIAHSLDVPVSLREFSLRVKVCASAGLQGGKRKFENTAQCSVTLYWITFIIIITIITIIHIYRN